MAIADGCHIKGNLTIVTQDSPHNEPGERCSSPTYPAIRGKTIPFLIWDGQRYSSLNAWRTAAGQEPVAVQPGALQGSAVPSVTTSAYALKDPRVVPKFFLMKWLAHSTTRGSRGE
ncbi:MAG: hypothetical protein H8F28_26485 [Fibrella sp.]|nr:hypothetical protein [Armatimonadota bacterium]